MARSIAVVAAASNIGVKPYDDGRARQIDRAPDALRAQGLVERLRARDLGDVVPAPYRDFVRPSGRIRNEAEVASYSRVLGDRVAAAAADGAFVLTLGGDCSIILGCLLGLRTPDRAELGLVYIDAHADYATPQVSRSGSAASMALALATGRGDTPLARLAGDGPLARISDVVVIGRRDDHDTPIYGQDALVASAALDFRCSLVRERGPAAIAHAVLERVAAPHVRGFLIHVDADSIDPTVVPAVDSPEPDGFGVDEIVALLTPLVTHPAALGLQLTIYDPGLDPDRTSAANLATILRRALAPMATCSSENRS
jgi:arginase